MLKKCTRNFRASSVRHIYTMRWRLTFDFFSRLYRCFFVNFLLVIWQSFWWKLMDGPNDIPSCGKGNRLFRDFEKNFDFEVFDFIFPNGKIMMVWWTFLCCNFKFVKIFEKYNPQMLDYDWLQYSAKGLCGADADSLVKIRQSFH